jgi:arylsulfatase A-like enzyme/virulence-associated protein VagC
LVALQVAACAKQPKPEAVAPQNLLASLKPLSSRAVGAVAALNDGFVLTEGDRWDSEGAAFFPRSESEVVFDLGRSLPINAAYLQADNNDRFVLSASTDGEDYKPIWVAPPVTGVGMRARVTNGLNASARFVKLALKESDGRSSVAEIQLFSSPPDGWPTKLPTVSSRCRFRGTPPERTPANNDIERPAAPKQAVYLTEVEGQINGRRAPEPKPVLEINETALRAWRLAPGRFRSQALRLPSAPRVGTMVMNVVPAGARSVTITPLAQQKTSNWERSQRQMVLPLLPAESNQPLVALKVDLDRVMHHNWGRLTTGLEYLEVDFDPADNRSKIENIEIFEAMNTYSEAAGVTAVELAGAIHPSWYLRAGSTVSFKLDIPADAPRFRCYVGTSTPAARPAMRIKTTPTTTKQLALPLAGAAWRRADLRLDEWAGRQVTLEISAEGESGVAFIGDPKILSAKQNDTPDVLLYLADEVAAGHLGAWGSPLRNEGVSTHFDALASEGITFGLAIPAASWTKPSVASLLSGTSPTTHGVGKRSMNDRLAAKAPMLQERFREAGFRTALFSANPFVGTLSGFERGFGSTFLRQTWDHKANFMDGPSAEELQASVIEWLNEEPEQPAFIYIHTLEPHEHGRDPFKVVRPGWLPYDHAIRAADGAFGSFRNSLDRLGRDQIVVLLSDHGETLNEPGRASSHGMSVYQSEIHVPLVFWSPGRFAPATFNTPVSLLDVSATLLDLFGLAPLPFADGVSLLPVMRGKAADPDRVVFSSREWAIWDPGQPALYAAIAADGMKLIVGSDGTRALFDIRTDPCERNPLPFESSKLPGQLSAWQERQKAQAEEYRRRYGEADDTAVTQRDVSALRSLGYIR